LGRAIKNGLPCHLCGSSDAVTTYHGEDGHDDNATCFSCNETWWLSSSTSAPSTEQQEEFMFTDDLPVVAIEERGITLKTVQHFDVRTEFHEETGEPSAYHFPFFKDNKQIAYKEKRLPKEYKWHGDSKDIELFGQNLVGEQGKMIIVCEGIEDTMCAYQLLQELNKNYKVVGLPNGVNSMRKHIEFLSGFETVIICFDTDQAGIEGARKSAELFKPGTAKVMNLGKYKDVNDLVVDGGTAQEFYGYINMAKSLTPVGIVDMSDSWDALFADDAIDSTPYPWKGVNEKLYGMRRKELVTVTAGSGLGKSAIVRELEHHLLTQTTDKIGVLALEEDVARTGWGIMSIEANIPLHIREERKGIPEEDLRDYFNATLGTGRVFTLDHFGSTASESLLNKIRYLVNGLGCSWIFLDHLSIVVSGMDDSGNERIVIDKLMTDLRSLVQETGCGMFLVSHLRRTGGDKGHEKGEEVSLSHLRGSQSIAQLSDSVIALERNQQADDERLANTTMVRILKNRYAGLTGLACALEYNKNTGRLLEVEPDDTEEFGF